MRAFMIAAAGAAMVLLGGCGPQTDANSGVTAEEADALNETEAMLDAPLHANDEMPMDDLGGDTGELPVTDEAATDVQ